MFTARYVERDQPKVTAVTANDNTPYTIILLYRYTNATNGFIRLYNTYHVICNKSWRRGWRMYAA